MALQNREDSHTLQAKISLCYKFLQTISYEFAISLLKIKFMGVGLHVDSKRKLVLLQSFHIRKDNEHVVKRVNFKNVIYRETEIHFETERK